MGSRLIIGGLAFTFHAKPRYTKDIAIKSAIGHPRHQDDARVLRRVREPTTTQE